MPRKTTQSTAAEIAALKQANEKLRKQNAELSRKVHDDDVFARGWRTVGIIFCVALATAVLVVGNLLFWAGDTLVNNDRYVQTVTPLLQDKAIQSAVADYTTNKLFENVDVDQAIQSALPPKASFLAAPLSSQVKDGTEQALNKVLASDKFQTVWEQANSKAHQRLITAIKESDGDGVLNLQEVYNRLSENLKDTKLSFLAGKQLPSDVGSIVVVQATWVPAARNVINNIGWIKPVSLAVVVLASAGAIWLSRNRRKLVIVLGSFFATAMLISLIAVRVVKSVAVSHVAPAYRTAADHAGQIIAQPLITQTRTVLLVSLGIVLVAWITGPYRAAVATRSRIELLLSGKLHQAIFSGRESAFTLWTAAHKRLLQWLSVGVVAVIMLFVRLTPGLVLLYAAIALLLVLLIETLAAKPAQTHQTK